MADWIESTMKKQNIVDVIKYKCKNWKITEKSHKFTSLKAITACGWLYIKVVAYSDFKREEKQCRTINTAVCWDSAILLDYWRAWALLGAKTYRDKQNEWSEIMVSLLEGWGGESCRRGRGQCAAEPRPHNNLYDCCYDLCVQMIKSSLNSELLRTELNIAYTHAVGKAYNSGASHVHVCNRQSRLFLPHLFIFSNVVFQFHLMHVDSFILLQQLTLQVTIKCVQVFLQYITTV